MVLWDIIKSLFIHQSPKVASKIAQEVFDLEEEAKLGLEQTEESEQVMTYSLALMGIELTEEQISRLQSDPDFVELANSLGSSLEAMGTLLQKDSLSDIKKKLKNTIDKIPEKDYPATFKK